MNFLKKAALVLGVLVFLGLAAYYVSPYRVLAFHPDGVKWTKLTESNVRFSPAGTHSGYIYADVSTGKLVGSGFDSGLLGSAFVYVVDDKAHCPEDGVIRRGVLCEQRNEHPGLQGLGVSYVNRQD